MPNRKQQILYITAHTLFWAGVCMCFCIFSFLRPIALHNWKEILSVLFIAGMVYLNYFVLVPMILLKRKRVFFWSCVIVLLIGIVAAEMLLVDADMRERMVWLQGDYTPYYSTAPFLLFFRDASFFLLFLMLKLYRVKAIVLERVEKMVTSETYKLIIISPNEKPQLIDFNNIVYFLFENGEIVVILKSGEKKFKSGSLSDIEKMIPSELWVRVNRQTLVMRDSIVRYTPTAICVAINGKEVSIPYYFTKQDEMISLLKAWNSDLYSPDDRRKEKTANEGHPLSDDLKRLLDYFNGHPDASVQQVAKDLYLSTRTAQRRMTELRQLGLLNSSKRG